MKRESVARLLVSMAWLAMLLAPVGNALAQKAADGDSKKVSCKAAGGSCIDACAKNCKGQCLPGKCTGEATRQCCVVSAASTAGGTTRPSGSDAVSDQEAIAVLVGLGLFVLFIAVLWRGISRRCPACTAWWALEKIASEEVDRRDVRRTVPKTATIIGRKDVKVVYTTEQKTFVQAVNQHTFRCRKCGHMTEQLEKVEFEG